MANILESDINMLSVSIGAINLIKRVMSHGKKGKI